MSDDRRTPTSRSPKLPPAELIELTPDVWTKPFWEAAAEHRLVVPRCTNCGTYRLPPSAFCYVCRTQEVEWVEQPGAGTLYSFTVAWHPLMPDVSDSVPYIPAVVELPGDRRRAPHRQPRRRRPSEVAIGMEVTCVWRDVPTASVTLFAPC